ncbi:hypothetical protein [Methanococcus maripaludis]|uniref:Uncharacterized protein n=2 Tax=Methanococcus maripaludis TaxID=39152 RepID=A0A7J9PN16_METMI|nr:hypothetical protein [Methanococcus maripaludis]MBA2862889.1 hypothetical protein [Methanococcus maripaludis]
MDSDKDKYQKIRENIKKLINNSFSSDDEFKTLLGHAYASLTSKNHRCMDNVLKRLKERYDVDLTENIDNLRIFYHNKKSELKTKDDLKSYVRNKVKNSKAKS